MAYSEDKKVEIRDRVRIEDLVRDYNVLLQPAGRGRLRALCPFHPEKTPSFHVNVEGQFFHCFGCKAGGDVFTFVQKAENVTFPEALEMLARRAGVILERVAGRGSSRGAKAAVYDALSLAEEYYHSLLLGDARAEPARRYLQGRGLRPETWDRFRLGYAPPEWDGFLRYAVGKGVDEAILEKAGLVREAQGRSHPDRRVYDYFRGRVMFPIADGQKRIVGFGARTLGDDQPKYLNTPKTLVFDKSQVLYGLPQARAAIDHDKRVAIVEGYTDAIAAHQEGLEFFVAGLGTAFTRENAVRLRRLAPRVDLVFDGDLAGQSAAERSLSLLVAEDLDVRVFVLDGGEDPFDAIMGSGGAEFRRRLDSEAVGVFEFKWRRTVGSVDASQGAGTVARAFDEVISLLGKVPNDVARRLYIKEFSERLGVPEAEIDRTMRKKGTGRPPASRRAGVPGWRGRGEDAGRPRWRSAGSASPSETATGGPERALIGGTESADNPTLEEVVIETLLAEPDRALSRWRELPQSCFEAAAVRVEIRAIAAAIGRQLEEGAFDIERLVGLLDNRDAVPLLARILGRIEQRRTYDARGRWAGVEDTDEIWRRCLREIERRSLLARRRDVLERADRARVAGDADGLLSAEREYMELLRRISSMNQGGR